LLKCAGAKIKMMKWAKERDLLIAQTMTFVQSITGKTPGAETRPEARIEFAAVDDIERVERPVEIVQMTGPSSALRNELRQEIQGRVAAFRAHQQLFDREREAYCKSVLTRVRDSIGRGLEPPRN
jgi:hypothetical protein